jgi:hypothetical protein
MVSFQLIIPVLIVLLDVKIVVHQQFVVNVQADIFYIIVYAQHHALLISQLLIQLQEAVILALRHVLHV